jgi:hypothetical protein
MQVLFLGVSVLCFALAFSKSRNVSDNIQHCKGVVTDCTSTFFSLYIIKGCHTQRVNSILGRAMAQAVSRRPLTAEALVRSRVGRCGICGGQSGTGTGFSPSTSVLPYQFHSTGAPLKWKAEKLSSSSSQGCTISLQGSGASVTSAAGPFNLKNSIFV